MSRPRIFVHIPSYRDRECQWTVRDLFAKARHPERIFVGICWQTLPEADADCFAVETRPEQVRSVHFHIAEARGLGWARQQAQRLWRGEEYSLQIDSHMRFVPDWDEAMLRTLAECGSPEPVLTVYPPGYVPPDRLQEPNGPAVQMVKGFLPTGLPEFGTAPLPAGVPADRPQPTAACAGGFIFGPARILRDVPADPEIYFNGEEPNLAVRLWTAGFDLFSPHRTLLYHYYERQDGSRHWNDSPSWNERHRRTVQRMRALCAPATCPAETVAALGPYGLGSRRSLAAYEAFSGIDFVGRTLARHAQVFPFVQPADSLPPPDETLRPAPGSQLFLLGEEAVLFRESAGEFYRLNASAAFVWCAREEGYSWSRVAAEQAATRGVPPEVAARDLARLAAHWQGQGLLVGPEEVPHPPPGTPRHAPQFPAGAFAGRSVTYRLLGVELCVRYGEAALQDLVHPVLAHLRVAPTGSPQAVFTLARIQHYRYLFRGEELVMHGENPAALAPVLKFQLLAAAIARQDLVTQLHAGAVAHAGCLVLLPGDAGDGKTLLTARLVAAGAQYFSDEVVLIERSGTALRPVPISLCVKATGVGLLTPHFPGLPDLPEHDREDGHKVRYLPPPSGALPPEGHAEQARLVVFRRFIPGAAQSLRPLSQAETLGRLMDTCVAIPGRIDRADAATLVGFARGLHGYQLAGGDLDEHAATVLRLCEALGRDGRSAPPR
ncbi:MAG: PqqD family peptide modification chaperone [Acetobacteraceae bacterium]